MISLFLVAALVGCHNPDRDTDTVDINPDDTATHGDDTGVNPSTMGYVDADAMVLGSPEACQANLFDSSGELVTTDYTGDDNLPSLKAGTYTVSFGVTAAELFPQEDEDYIDAVNDVVDDMLLHQDTEGNLWTGLEQEVVVTAGATTPVEGNLSRVPALCPSDEDGCDGQDDEVGQWTVEQNGEIQGQDFIEVNQFREETWLTISIPGIGDLVLDGDRIYLDGAYEGGYINSGWIEVYDLNNSTNDVVLWVGRDGDDPR